MRKFTASQIAALVFSVFLVTASASAQFVAYNDFGGTASGYDANQVVTGYTASAGGMLYDFGTANSTGVTMTLSQAKDPSGGTLTPGTPAYNVFSDKVNVNGYMSNNYHHSYTINFTGLDPNTRYEVVLFGDAGLTGNTTSNVYTIGGTATPTSFTNISSGAISGTSQQTATMIVGDNGLTGYIGDYTDIDPGSDGQFLVNVTASGGDGVWRLNALMLETVFDANVAATPTDLSPAVSAQPVPEPMTLCLIGVGALLVIRRRHQG